MKLRKVTALVAVAVLLGVGVILVYEPSRTFMNYGYTKLRGGYTVSERLQQYGPDVEQRLKADFERAGVPYPPAEVAYVAFKDASLLEVYARPSDTAPWQFIRTYPVLKASGELGPKLREGDRQVPEGVYRSEFLNANSRYHLSIRVNYPNEFDRQMARADGRDQLGGDIMIHGSAFSIGCLAMGNPAAEDLFVLAALTESGSVNIVISPTDFRQHSDYAASNGVPWLDELYAQLRVELEHFSRDVDHPRQGVSL